MKITPTAITIALLLAHVSVCQAKMDFDAPNCIVESVIVHPEKIVMVVSGECSFIVAQGGSSGAIQFSALKMLMDSTTVVIPRRDSANSYKSWDDYCTQAKALAGRKAHLQLNSNSEIIEEGRLVFVSANFASFYEVKP